LLNIESNDFLTIK